MSDVARRTMDKIIDIEAVLGGHAWQESLLTSRRGYTCFPKSVKMSKYDIEGPAMDDFRFKVIDQEFKPTDPETAPGYINYVTGEEGHTRYDVVSVRVKNGTDRIQTFRIECSRKSRPKTQVKVHEGYSFWREHQPLSEPVVCPNRQWRDECGQRRREEFDNDEEGEHRKTLVLPAATHSAVTITEHYLSGTFKITQEVSVPLRPVTVSIRNKQGKLLFSKELKDAALLFPPHAQVKDAFGVVQLSVLEFIVEGIVRNKLLALTSREDRRDAACGVDDTCQEESHNADG